MNPNTQVPTWLDSSLYPFAHKYIHLSAGKMHYVEEGAGEVILFVHGTPTWSLLYRNMIKSLSTQYRCIAIDHIGFGLSEKVSSFSGKPEDHAQHLSEFIQQLDLKNITLVVHDFGGPIGLGAAIQHPDRIQKIVLMNTWLWATKENSAAQKIDRIVKGWMGKFLYLNMNFSPRVLLKKGFADKKRLAKNVHQHYLRPFPDKLSRYPLLQLAEALVGSSDWYQQQWEQLEVLTDKKWLIVWGMKDPFLNREYLDKWRKRLPHAQVSELDCGHFVQEEKAQELIAEIRNLEVLGSPI